MHEHNFWTRDLFLLGKLVMIADHQTKWQVTVYCPLSFSLLYKFVELWHIFHFFWEILAWFWKSQNSHFNIRSFKCLSWAPETTKCVLVSHVSNWSLTLEVTRSVVLEEMEAHKWFAQWILYCILQFISCNWF